MDNEANTEFSNAALFNGAGVFTICSRMIGQRLVDLPGALQNEFWRFKLAGWVNDLNGRIEFTR